MKKPCPPAEQKPFNIKFKFFNPTKKVIDTNISEIDMLKLFSTYIMGKKQLQIAQTKERIFKYW